MHYLLNEKRGVTISVLEKIKKLNYKDNGCNGDYMKVTHFAFYTLKCNCIVCLIKKSGGSTYILEKS